MSAAAAMPLPPILAAAVAGILCDRLFALPFWFWFLCGLAALLLWCFLRHTSAKLCCFYAVCFVFFGIWHHDHWFRYAANDIGNFAISGGEPAAVIGTVREMPQFSPKPPREPGRIFDTSERTDFAIIVSQIRDGKNWMPAAGNLAVMVYADCRSIRIGDQVRLFGTLIKPHKPDNPGDLDYAAFLRTKRIRATISCPGIDAVTILQKNQFFLFRWFESIRRQGLRNLERHLSPQTIPVAEAMLFDVRAALDDSVWQSMQETGTVHLLSISGLHVTLVAGIVAWVLRFLQCSRKQRAAAMVACILFYLLLTEVRPPAVRASALVCSGALAIYLNRQTFNVNLLCASALFVLLLCPSELFQFGTQLSFLSVGAFLWLPKFADITSAFYVSSPADTDARTLADIERVETAMPPLLRFARWSLRTSAALLMTSTVIWLVTLPMIMSIVHQCAPIALIVNPLLLPLLPIVMLAGLLTALLGQIPILGTLCGFTADWSFAIMLNIIAWFQNLGGHYWVPGIPAWWNIGFYGVFSIFTFLPIRRPKRILALLLIFWIAAGLGSGYYRNYERLRSDRLTLSIFSVGHGNCILIAAPDKKTIICDVGCLNSPRRAADVMSRAVWRLGKRHIDAVILTHADTDHINGLQYLLDRFSIGTILVTPYFLDTKRMPDKELWALLEQTLKAKNVPIRILSDGDTLAEYGLPHSKVLHPPLEFAEQNNVNAASMVVWFEHHGQGVLLTGDLDGQAPAPFLRREPIKADILLMPHHGGKSSQAALLLEWTKPKTLIYSNGKMTYKPEVLRQLRQQGYEVHSTHEEGMVEINL